MLFPYKPVQAGYSADFVDGLISTALDGGPPSTRLDILGAPATVNATWVLKGQDYSIFQGYVRNWYRSGGVPFDMPLILDADQMDTYQVMFTPGSPPRLVSKNSNVYTVAGTLLVLPLDKYLDEAEDPFGALAALVSTYGDIQTVIDVLNLLAELVNVHLPSYA